MLKSLTVIKVNHFSDQNVWICYICTFLSNFFNENIGYQVEISQHTAEA